MSEQETKLTKITMEFVEEQTDTRSLLRGEDYYKRNAVREIIFNKETDRVSASVRGAMQYTVTINAVSVSPEFSCTCPVGYRYMCKHGVAVALTILNNPGFIQLSDGKKVTKKIPALPLKKVFQQATPAQKEMFLWEIMQNDNTQAEKFCSFVLGPLAMESDLSIENIRDDVKKSLENFDLTDYQRFYARFDTSQYWEEWELLYQGALGELQELCDTFTGNSLHDLNTGNIIDAVKKLLGIYEGIGLMDEYSVEDPCEIFTEGIQSTAFYIFKDFFEKFVSHFAEIEKDEEVILRISQILENRIHYYIELANNNEESEEEETAFQYNINILKLFLKQLIISESTANYWKSIFQRYGLRGVAVNELLMTIASMLSDNDAWLKIANEHFRESKIITQKILEYYQKVESKANFIRVGKYALETWGRSFDEYLYKNLTKSDDPDFFESVLAAYTKRMKSIPLFREYKTFFGQEKASEFVKKFKEKERLYYIHLLEEEKEFSLILQLLKQDGETYYFIEALTPILNIYPAECFDIIRSRTDKLLADHTGREVYRVAVQWLKLLLKIEDNEIRKECWKYFAFLYNTYNRRPALKDEFKKAGLC